MPSAKSEPWFAQVAARMVRTGENLRAAYFEIFSLTLSVEEADRFLRLKNFQKILREERNRFFNELGSDPLKTKQTALGRLEFIVQKLLEGGEFEKAAEVQFKAAKIEGWLSPETNVNVFANLTEKEIQELREKVRQQALMNKEVN